ncbi:MAG: matrixin family metalloprotease [Deltaproteobacteria bacterium]|nr:matrixin family metalloprotease [Deltaproteobacteria bacterium]
MTRLLRCRILLLSSFVFLTCGALPSAAYFCTLTEDGGPSLGWDERDIGMVLGQKNGGEVRFTDLENATAHALAQWQQAGCSDVQLSITGSSDDLRTGFDWRAGADSPENRNVIVFRNDDENDPVDAWLYDNGAIAITTVTYSRFSGRILDADIELNDRAFVFTECDNGEPGCLISTDLKNTLTHEVGHLLGLDHPSRDQADYSATTMYGSAAEGDVQKRDLAQDDIDGICFLYPAGAANQSCYADPSPEPAIVITGGCAHALPSHVQRLPNVSFLCCALFFLASTLRRRKDA